MIRRGRQSISFFRNSVRQLRGLDLNLGIGNVLKDNNQPKYDGSTSNTHSTVIKGPLGLPTLTVSHTHGNSGVAIKPDLSVGNNDLLFDQLGQTTVNANKPKCDTSPLPISGLNVNIHFGRPSSLFELSPPPLLPPHEHKCEILGNHEYSPQSPPLPPSPPSPPASSVYNHHHSVLPNQLHLQNPSTNLVYSQLNTPSTTTAINQLIDEVFGKPANGNENIATPIQSNGASSGINPTNSESGGLGTYVHGPPEETGNGFIDIRGTFEKTAKFNVKQRPKY